MVNINADVSWRLKNQVWQETVVVLARIENANDGISINSVGEKSDL